MSKNRMDDVLDGALSGALRGALRGALNAALCAGAMTCAAAGAGQEAGPAAVAAAGLPDPLARSAQATPKAGTAVMLGLAQAGTRLVGVGERGVVLVSDDAGARWSQVPTPVSTTLTAVKFVDAQHGWAVGHAGVVLRTLDGGATWQRQLDGRRMAELALQAVQAAQVAQAPQPALLKNAERLVADGPDKPLLDLHFFDARRGVVIGAYGLVFGTEDGGETWVPWLDRIDNPKGLHLNAIAAQGEQLLVAGEQGLLLRSADGGRSFTRLASPYEGSWFAALAIGPGQWLLGGLKGHVYRLDGDTFAAAEMPVPVTVAALGRLRDGQVLALNQAGQALASRDEGRHFQPVAWPPGPPLTAVVEAEAGRFVAASLRGPRQLPTPKTAP